MSSTKYHQRSDRRVDVDQAHRLDLLLRFARANLEKMTARELVQLGRKLAILLHYYELGEDFSITVPGKLIDRLVGRRGEKLKHLQACITEFLDDVMQKDPGEFPIETEFTGKLRLQLIPDQTFYAEAKQSPSKTEPADMLRFKTSVEVSPDEDGVLHHLRLALNGVPISSFKRCGECRGWFLHLTERPRKFCSHLCGARASRRNRYQEMKAKNPKLYKAQLEQGRQRARKSSQQKAGKAPLGPHSGSDTTSGKEEV
jgi:hypothetical protein